MVSLRFPQRRPAGQPHGKGIIKNLYSPVAVIFRPDSFSYQLGLKKSKVRLSALKEKHLGFPT
jgi:hypothetical protein